jgi:hypothetical protein
MGNSTSKEGRALGHEPKRRNAEHRLGTNRGPEFQLAEPVLGVPVHGKGNRRIELDSSPSPFPDFLPFRYCPVPFVAPFWTELLLLAPPLLVPY